MMLSRLISTFEKLSISFYCSTQYSRKLSTTKSLFQLGAVDEERSVFRPRRSILFVPADDPKKVNKATKLPADCIVLECEDGVAINKKSVCANQKPEEASLGKLTTQFIQQDNGCCQEEDSVFELIQNCWLDLLPTQHGPVKMQKNEARTNVNQMLGNLSFEYGECAVRVNSVGCGLADEDLKAALTGKVLPEAILLPKVEEKEHIVWFADQMQKYIKERKDSTSSRVALVLFIETAIGLLNMRSILEAASVSDLPFRHEAVTFGADDFLASIGGAKTDDAKELMFARQYVVTHCKAFGLQAIDMVHINFKDLETLKIQSVEGFRMGFTGKQLIHPGQISVINEAFTPSKEKMEWAEELVQAFEGHQKTGKGAFVFQGSMIDMPLLKQAQNIIRLAEVIHKKGTPGT